MIKTFAVAMSLSCLASAYEKCSSSSDKQAYILTIDLDIFDMQGVFAIQKNGIKLD